MASKQELDYRELARRSCEAQGLQLEITDPERRALVREALARSLAGRGK